MTNSYIGSELELFANAANWKSYWAGALKPYLGKSILDVGAGIGGTAKVYASLQCDSYLALEPDALLAGKIQAEIGAGSLPANLAVAVGTIESLGSEQRFDTILYIDVLEHIADDEAELKRASEHLTSDGRILVLAPAHQWLYSEFDAAIGHFRRYDKKSLEAAKPDGFITERMIYLDSVGLLASLANRWLLKASSPSSAQIGLWDGRMVPVSKRLDKILAFKLGKTIIASFRRRA